MSKLKVTLKKSLIGTTERQKATAVGLGLRRPNHERVLENTPAVRGMVKQLIHLLDVAEVEG